MKAFGNVRYLSHQEKWSLNVFDCTISVGVKILFYSNNCTLHNFTCDENPTMYATLMIVKLSILILYHSVRWSQTAPD